MNQTEIYNKTYSVAKGYHKGKSRFFAVSSGRITSLHYATYKKALSVAKRFTEAINKNFVRSNGTKVIFNVYQV